MKIKIGPYLNWIGPYQIADWLSVFGISEERCQKIGDYLASTWVNDFCKWIDQKRTEEIHIDPFDTWNMDRTLSLIIEPMLRQLHETAHVAPYVNDEDVPEELRALENSGFDSSDDLHFARWDWIMNEMIWAFEQVNSDWEDNVLTEETNLFGSVEYDKHTKRMQRGFELFGKYFRNLWG